MNESIFLLQLNACPPVLDCLGTVISFKVTVQSTELWYCMD